MQSAHGHMSNLSHGAWLPMVLQISFDNINDSLPASLSPLQHCRPAPSPSHSETMQMKHGSDCTCSMSYCIIYTMKNKSSSTYETMYTCPQWHPHVNLGRLHTCQCDWSAGHATLPHWPSPPTHRLPKVIMRQCTWVYVEVPYTPVSTYMTLNKWYPRCLCEIL